MPAFAHRIAHRLRQAPPHATGVLVVRLGAVRRNYRKLRSMARGAETAAVVKANAYGLGAEQCVPLFEEDGCRCFFVATLGEAEAVRSFSARAMIYALNGLFPNTAARFDELNVRPVLGSLEEVAEWAAYARSVKQRLPAAIHIDTGMERLGVPAYELEQLAKDGESLDAFRPSLIVSHLACGDNVENPKNEEQRALFEGRAAPFVGVPRSLAASSGVLLGPAYHFDVTRPGIALYGGRAQNSEPNPMEPAVWLFGRIAQTHWAEPGETVGYGATHTLKRRTRIATVCAGYADGFFRALSASDAREGPAAHIGVHRLPLLGRVSMDLVTFDATDAPEDAVQRGDWLELLGGRVTVDDWADFAGAIGYEVLTSLGSRYHRIYVDE